MIHSAANGVTRRTFSEHRLHGLASDVQITLNDDPRTVSDGCSVAELLAVLEMNPRFVAVEINGVLIPREDHGQRELCNGDRLEIVTLVGGG